AAERGFPGLAPSPEVAGHPFKRKDVRIKGNLWREACCTSFCTVSRRALVCESSHSRCGLSCRAQFGVVVLRLLFEPSRSVCESLNSRLCVEPSCSRVFGVVVLQCELYS
ncbi:hypothetical protein Taro_001600, partial [Colocasia esculenta]|nr:hypothetical protein [Colocasia esculenta]